VRRAFAQGAVALSAGIVFGVGLTVSGMADPAKVKGFLDIAGIASGAWDPSLAFVMGAAVVVAFIFFRLRSPPNLPILDARFHASTGGKVERRLIVGSAIFGVGWGLSGLCPGPAFVDLGLAPGAVILFVVAMMLGSWATGLALRSRQDMPGDLGDVPAE